MPRKAQDLTGQVFGRLTVIRRGDNKGPNPAWICACQCGKETGLVLGSNLKKGMTRSCGCLRVEFCKEKSLGKDKAIPKKNVGPKRQPGHLKTKTRVYRIWSGMLQRCSNEKDISYRYYGGRGITVCERWKKFDNFFMDMGDPPEDCSLDRIDGEKGYSPENCRWATSKEQQRNRRYNIYVEFRGKYATLAEHCEEVGISYRVAHMRITRSGWDVERALTVPARGYSFM